MNKNVTAYARIIAGNDRTSSVVDIERTGYKDWALRITTTRKGIVRSNVITTDKDEKIRLFYKAIGKITKILSEIILHGERYDDPKLPIEKK